MWRVERTKVYCRDGTSYIINNLWNIFRKEQFVGRAFYVYEELFVFNITDKPIKFDVPKIIHAVEKLESVLI
jgi:hypothetical protein